MLYHLSDLSLKKFKDRNTSTLFLQNKDLQITVATSLVYHKITLMDRKENLYVSKSNHFALCTCSWLPDTNPGLFPDSLSTRFTYRMLFAITTLIFFLARSQFGLSSLKLQTSLEKKHLVPFEIKD